MAKLPVIRKAAPKLSEFTPMDKIAAVIPVPSKTAPSDEVLVELMMATMEDNEVPAARMKNIVERLGHEVEQCSSMNASAQDILTNLITGMIIDPNGLGYDTVTVTIAAERSDSSTVDMAYIVSNDDSVTMLSTSGEASIQKLRGSLVDTFKSASESLLKATALMGTRINHNDGSVDVREIKLGVISKRPE